MSAKSIAALALSLALLLTALPAQAIAAEPGEIALPTDEAADVAPPVYILPSVELPAEPAPVLPVLPEATIPPVEPPYVDSVPLPSDPPVPEPTPAPTQPPELTPEATPPPEIEASPEPAPAPEIEPSPEPTQPPEEPEEPGESDEEEEDSEENSESEPLVVSVSAPAYAFAARDSVTVAVHIQGGTPDYTILYQLYYMDFAPENLVAEHVDSQPLWSFQPPTAGEYGIVVSVVDSLGCAQSSAAQLTVAQSDPDNALGWLEKLAYVQLGGHWPTDILAVAATQLGYQESSLDFVLDEAGLRKGRSIYGQWYGVDYGDWCAMFVAFCLYHAGVPQEYYPHDAACEIWRQELINIAACEPAAAYLPQPGDLVFFDISLDAISQADHMGIVVSLQDGVLTTVEGNNADMVALAQYPVDSAAILGYANTSKLMSRAKALADIPLTVEISVGGRTDILTQSADAETAAPEDEAADNELAFSFTPTPETEPRKVWDPDKHSFVTLEPEDDSWQPENSLSAGCISVINTSPVSIYVELLPSLKEAYSGQLSLIIEPAVAALEPGGKADFNVRAEGTIDALSTEEALGLGRIGISLSRLTQQETSP